MKNRILGMALAAAALGLSTMGGAAIAIRPQERPPEHGLGWTPRRGRSKSHSRTPRFPRDGNEAYKRQRRANRLRRKALNK